MEQLQGKIGSEAWTGGREYQGDYADRIRFFTSAFNESPLLHHASTLRNGVPCTLDANFAVGSFNFVKKITFQDGVEWIARLRLPPIEAFEATALSRMPYPDEEEKSRILYDMQSEIDTMEFIRRNSTTPLPTVFGSNLTWDNEVGFPYSFSQYFPFSTAEELARSLPGDHNGIPEEHAESFFMQIAQIMHRLANIRMPRIGSIRRSRSEPGGFEIGPLAETLSGPYERPADFYADYPVRLAEMRRGRTWNTGVQGELISLVQGTFLEQQRTAHVSSDRDYGLVNYDLGPNNCLVDREFNIIAVIDWDSVAALPDPCLYRLPFLMGISLSPPGQIDDRKAVQARECLARRFAEIVEATSTEMSTESNSRFVFTQAGFYSRGAAASRALVYFKMNQEPVDREWAVGLKWLEGKEDNELLEFYMRKE